MKKILRFLLFFFFVGLLAFTKNETEFQSWIRINQLGYRNEGIKVAVWCALEKKRVRKFELVDVSNGKVVYSAVAGKDFGSYGPFESTYRLDFSTFNKSGDYYLRSGKAVSPHFRIGTNVYSGTADFCLQYMRQQRTGFNPFLRDSCHTRDGYTLNGPMPDSTYIDVVGGWHDASDYLQYSTTSANATYHLLMAYRDFPAAFRDEKLSNGTEGQNGTKDVLDEAKWGLDWLLKMHPRKDWMFNQIADDRDHISMRIPKLDSMYGRGHERPVYFIDGKPQQRGKGKNNTTGTSSTAAKFSSAFALGASIYSSIDNGYSKLLEEKSLSAYHYANIKPGVTQTVSVRAPYIYAEENWVDDMELASTYMNRLNEAYQYAGQEPLTPWLGSDTAKHYQWYPFINLGHYELAKRISDLRRDTLLGYYRRGIQKVYEKGLQNAFYRGIPFIWCSNNLTTSFAIQCGWYRKLSNDAQFEALEQANIDWLFGCNPWGTSMVYGLPSWGDTPIDPHSAFTHLKNYPINGGLVDGPVYASIYNNLIGITLNDPDEYARFQSALVVYHDDYGDYSTNEPTMDGTAALIYLLASLEED